MHEAPKRLERLGVGALREVDEAGQEILARLGPKRVGEGADGPGEPGAALDARGVAVGAAVFGALDQPLLHESLEGRLNGVPDGSPLRRHARMDRLDVERVGRSPQRIHHRGLERSELCRAPPLAFDRHGRVVLVPRPRDRSMDRFSGPSALAAGS